MDRAIFVKLEGLCHLSSSFTRLFKSLRLCPLQPHALLQRVKSCISDEEEEKLMQITSLHSLNAFLLPIKTVGVQVIQLVNHFIKSNQSLCVFVLSMKGP